jgi:diaminohydroxyphosphoribosylaminopyrimidine deaminase/5-amino-6-(5-phosphoribosylamino)uracil reductase
VEKLSKDSPACASRAIAQAGIAVTDRDWMSLALGEARKGVGRTAPNPPVGSVLVKDGVVLGRGWHRAAGRPHAEREALADAFERHGREAVRGATAFVTLEPCSTHGRTPPCTDGLIEAGVTRVVYAATDRNPAHSGQADAVLRAAGIAVTSGVLAAESERLLRPFFKVQETGLPWVIWKTAMSLDGRLTRPPGEGRWLSHPDSRADVQRLRAEVDAMLTSGETVRRDLPILTIREAALLEGREQPWRVVVTDRPESLPMDAPLFTDAWRERTLIRPAGDLAGVLRRLAAEQGVLSALVEAGGVFSAALLEAGLIDEVVVYLAPLLCGGDVPALGGVGLAGPLKLADIVFERIGDDVKLRARIA